MPEPDIPKLKVPFEINPVTSRAELVEQDSLDEVSQCVTAIAATEIGSREEDPEFGIPDLTFTQNGPDPAAIREAVEEYEPRAEVFTDMELLGRAATVRARVNVRKESEVG